MSFSAGVGLSFNFYAVGAIAPCDFTRFQKTRTDVWKSTIWGVLPMGIITLVLGIIMTKIANDYDISMVLISAGIPVLGVASMILSTWTTNATNAYTGALSTVMIFNVPDNRRREVTLLYGCTVLGTGGGGGLEEGLEMMEEDFQAGRELKVVDVTEIPDDAYIATPYGCGAPTPAEGVELEEKYRRLPQIEGSPAVLAFQKLEQFMDKKFFAVSSTELGGLNTAEALHIACLLGIPIADADPAGRSVPELQHSTYYIKKVPIAPMGLATQFGDVAILSDVFDDLRAEEMVRAMAVASNDLIGVADHPTTGKIYRESVIVGALSYARRVGELLRLAKESGGDAAQMIADSENGKVLFHGTVTATPWASWSAI